MKLIENTPHAKLSASGAHRWMTCPASATLEQQFPETSSEAAEEGTLAHALAKDWPTLTNSTNNSLNSEDIKASFLGLYYNDDAAKALAQKYLTDEMCKHVNDYWTYIQNTAQGATYILENRVDLSKWIPEGFGTVDCAIIETGKIHIIDFKYGKGVAVSAADNPQLLLYALGIYDKYGFISDIKTVECTIFQPRIKKEPDTFSCDIQDLLDFGQKIRPLASVAYNGQGGYNPSEKTCRFCKAKGKCRARAAHNISLLEGYSGTMTPEEMSKLLDVGKDLVKWYKDLESSALSDALKGVNIPGWKAVHGRSQRAWTNQDAAFKELKENGVADAILYDRKPLSIAQIEKVIDKDTFQKCVTPYIHTPPGTPTLVPESDKRNAISNQITAAEAFDNAL